eukprot:jgi/Botrbrau1/581/Bobra.0010s0047.1
MSEERMVLEVRGLKRVIGDRPVLVNISFTVASGEVVFIRGPSGVGKTVLLRAVAYLDQHQEGSVLLNGKSPKELGVPRWRANVTYIPQSQIRPKGTPSELYFQAQHFSAQRGRPRGDLPALIADFGLEQGVLNQPWSELSGGQTQRTLLAVCLALKPQVLLLDEPTSALDHLSALRVEAVLKGCGAAIIWVTHDDRQPNRVGGLQLTLPLGTLSQIAPTADDGTEDLEAGGTPEIMVQS